MTWTTTKPTQPGWYWWRNLSKKYKGEQGPYVYHVWQSEDDGLKIYNCAIDARAFDGEWAGPLPEPTERDERETL